MGGPQAFAAITTRRTASTTQSRFAHLTARARRFVDEQRSPTVTDGSHALVHTLLQHDLVDELHLLLYPLILGGGKRLLPDRVHRTFRLKSATSYPSGVVGLHYERERQRSTNSRIRSTGPRPSRPDAADE